MKHFKKKSRTFFYFEFKYVIYNPILFKSPTDYGIEEV